MSSSVSRECTNSLVAARAAQAMAAAAANNIGFNTHMAPEWSFSFWGFYLSK